MKNQQAGSVATVPAAVLTAGGPLQQSYPGLGGHFGVSGLQGSGNADGLLLSTLVVGSLALSADAATGLIYMIQEEKMARDLYDTFADQTGSVVFDRISASEQKHMDSLLLVAQKAGIDVSSVSTAVGVFGNTAIQGLYDTLLAQGSVSLDAAYGVGVLVEQTDIAALQQYSADPAIGIVGTVYGNLEAGSDHHLVAFAQQAALVC